VLGIFLRTFEFIFKYLGKPTIEKFAFLFLFGPIILRGLIGTIGAVTKIGDPDDPLFGSTAFIPQVSKVKFDDVVGCDEVKSELIEVR
jgi:hypothetical protein